MTSLHSQSHGVYDFQESLRQEHLESMFPALLRVHGYHTGYVGKWGIGREPTEQFDRWIGYAGQGGHYTKRDGHLTDIQTRQALDFLMTRPHAKPFLLIVSYKAAHGPQQPQRRFAHLYRDTVFPRPPTDPAHPDRPAVHLPQMLETYSHHMRRYQKFIGTDTRYQRFMRNYYQVLTGMDESLGLTLGELERLGLSESTAVLFTSDNGHMLGEHGLYGKSYMYEESIRVPLLIAPAPRLYPEFRHRVLAAPALNIDIAPTLLSLAGLPPPPAMQGMDLLQIVVRPETPTRSGWYYEGPQLPQHSVLCEGYRTLDWKYVRYFTPDRSQLQECLYDLAADPRETRDLAPLPGHARQLSEMRRLLLAERDRLSRA